MLRFLKNSFQKFAVIFLFINTFFPSVSWGTNDVKVRYEYYEISGRTEQELRRQMNLKGIRQNGRPFDARTDWFVKWNYRYKNVPGGCGIASAEASVDIKIRLPKWKDSNSAPHALQKKWNLYLQALMKHEEGHQAFGIDAMKQVRGSIARMRPQSSCQEMKLAANALGERIIEKYRLKEIEYDRVTDHGATQGARFP